jgi:hypothetical protein
MGVTHVTDERLFDVAIGKASKCPSPARPLEEVQVCLRTIPQLDRFQAITDGAQLRVAQ